MKECLGKCWYEKKGDVDKLLRGKVLKWYGRDLIKEARAGNLDPVSGLYKEIRSVERTLMKMRNNTPVLVGEPNQTTAVVEGIAQKIVNGSVPSELADVRLIALDTGALLLGSGAKFEKRFSSLLKEVGEAKDGKNVILFIDDIDFVLGEGPTTEGPMHAALVLKAMLAKGLVRCIGATVVDKDYAAFVQLVHVPDHQPRVLKNNKYQGQN